jgi:hypothetical protein
MVKFIGGMVFGWVAIVAWAAFGEEGGAWTSSTINQLKIQAETFVSAGGKGSDGNMHMLHVEADGSVKCLIEK